VGQVVRHKVFGYRGVVSGYDQKPGVNVSKWEGVIKLPQGQEQPFYKVE
jgi:hemimethylated DNA binding protein